MKRKVIIGGIAGISAAALIITGIIRAAGSSGNAVQVGAARIEKGEISSTISSDGVVEEVEKAEIFFDTPLKVLKVLAEEGQKVSKGQQILELDLSALYSELEASKVNRNTKQMSLESKVLDAEVERAYNNLKAAERNYEDAKKAYEDNKVLYEANAISKAELEMSEKNFKEAESGVNGLKNARIAYAAAVENRKNSIKSAEDSIKVLDIQISNLEKKIATIENECKSPIDGVIANVNVQEGAFTTSMQPAYKVINPDKLQVRARINEYDIKNIAKGQLVRITGDAISEDTEVTGSVKSVSPVAVTNMTASGNETVVEVVIDIDGAGDVLKPGLNVTCEIAAITRKDVMLAPMEAITPDKDNNFMVFVIDEDKLTMNKRQVNVGINSDMYVEILDGLNEGDLVVIDPQPSYRDGMRVKVKE
ncbi:MAG: efflux RND transporter periplasmic adaptor subunit [Acetivibrionales bacterium]|jgi:HlyD family secretion protein